MTHQHKNAICLIMLCSVLAVAFTSLASATTAALTATATTNSSVITVGGSGFDPQENVTLAMLNQTDSSMVYSFTENITTDGDGAFSKNVTLPPGVYGTYNLTAETSTVTAYTQYTIPDAATLNSTPNDSNVIALVGTGFNAQENVTLQLNDTTTTVYTFPNNITTDTQGNFNTTVIIPTSLSGDYTLSASTSTASANATITVPDLTGPTGSTGATGSTGQTGATGATGAAADVTIGYFAIVLSIAAVSVAVLTLIKKH